MTPERTNLHYPEGPIIDSSKNRLMAIAPALVGATSFACSDVLGRITLKAGADVLTVSLFRGITGLLLLFVWLRLGTAPVALSPRARRIALGVGIFMAGNVFLLFQAIAHTTVPIAILTYFVYPLLTGIAASALGIDKLTGRGVATALAAFAGLALMIGAEPVGLAAVGIIAALGAALCRMLMLLITRSALQGDDPRLITWYSLVSSTAVFAVVAAATLNWQPPSSSGGWLALIVLSVAVTVSFLCVYASTALIGPFRTALFMNLETPLATLGSAVFLGETITPLQMLGGAVMVIALVLFQIRR
jgi:drug/metabolite transporter (DMT)-like permease